MGRTHVVGALATLWLIPPAADGSSSFVLLALAAILGGLLPDLDASDSKLQRLSVGGVTPFSLPAQVLHQTFGHRGALHSALGWLAASFLIAVPIGIYQGKSVGVALSLGYASHLLLDALTRSGIALRFPSPRRVRLLPVRYSLVTGSPPEEIVFATLAMLAIARAALEFPLQPRFHF